MGAAERASVAAAQPSSAVAEPAAEAVVEPAAEVVAQLSSVAAELPSVAEVEAASALPWAWVAAARVLAGVAVRAWPRPSVQVAEVAAA